MNENVWIAFKMSLKFVAQVTGLNQPYFSIGSDNGLVPTRQQAIIWANEG